MVTLLCAVKSDTLSYPAGRIHRLALVPDLEVQHRTPDRVRVAYRGHDFVPGHLGPHPFEDLGGMGIKAEIAAAMINDYHITKSLEIIGKYNITLVN